MKTTPNYTVNKNQEILLDGIKIGYIDGFKVTEKDRKRGVKNTFKIVLVSGNIIDMSNYGYFRDVVRDIKNGNAFHSNLCCGAALKKDCTNSKCTMDSKPPVKLKQRILLASMFFDLGKNHSAMYCPLVNVYFDFNNQEKPLHFNLKYKWVATDIWVHFNDASKKMFSESGLTEYCITLIKDNFTDYKGDFYMDFTDAFYISSKGKEIGFVKDFETAKQLYQTLIS